MPCLRFYTILARFVVGKLHIYVSNHLIFMQNYNHRSSTSTKFWHRDLDNQVTVVTQVDGEVFPFSVNSKTHFSSQRLMQFSPKFKNVKKRKWMGAINYFRGLWVKRWGAGVGEEHYNFFNFNYFS